MPARRRGRCCSPSTRCRTTARCLGRNLEDNLAGARVEVDAHKRNPADFVLWKLSSENEPGWDIAMGTRPARLAHRMLRHEQALSGPGVRHPCRRPRPDLSAPRERDRPVALAARHAPRWRRYWMHNGFLQVEGQKMSKIARQLHHHQRPARDRKIRRPDLAGRSAAPGHADDALSRADRFHRSSGWRRRRTSCASWQRTASAAREPVRSMPR